MRKDWLESSLDKNEVKACSVVGRGEKSSLRGPRSEVRLGREKAKKANIIDRMSKKNGGGYVGMHTAQSTEVSTWQLNIHVSYKR